MFDGDLSLRHGFLCLDGVLPFMGSSREMFGWGSTVNGFLSFDREILARWSSWVPLGLAKTIPGCRPRSYDDPRQGRLR
ncbi:hypothetical protein Syun_001164 [Stephania yunnanensis]|uniref:Uncharacterized protein n=1 Tax=Stephania yunnanensis TaxID=152371 RepID=A0AAP0LIV2_9MAGN